MPRKGFEKVRSGCITCKARKVKCDEGRPGCLRCQTSGRVCGGYRRPPPGSFSWNSLLRIQPSAVPDLDSSSTELRGLDFFRCVVAPALTSPFGNPFWTRSVCQLVVQEPATRYAVLAISSLYEKFDLLSHGPSTSNEYAVAIRYYNKALRQVATSEHLEMNIVLLICILFTCIEFLRGNAIAAIEHCRHGIYILGSLKQAPSDTSAIIHHLSIFPFFFGATLSDFPLLRNPTYPSQSIRNLAEAAETLDILMSRSIRLVRAFDPYRLGIVDISETSSSLILAQREICRDLDDWYAEFSAFVQNSKPNDRDLPLLRTLEVRWIVCKIWVQIASCQDEMFCDTFQNQFERIIKLAHEDAVSRRLAKPERINIFKFEMGISPLLHFVLLKCRFLQLRLEALELLRALGGARESLWDADLMHAIGRRIIEREHGLDISALPTQQDLGYIHLDYALPGDDKRIRDSWLDDETRIDVDCNGLNIIKRRIFFYVRNEAPGRNKTVADWISLLGN